MQKFKSQTGMHSPPPPPISFKEHNSKLPRVKYNTDPLPRMDPYEETNKNNKQHLLPPIQRHHQLQQEKNALKQNSIHNNIDTDSTHATNITYRKTHTSITTEHKQGMDQEFNLLYNTFQCYLKTRKGNTHPM